MLYGVSIIVKEPCNLVLIIEFNFFQTSACAVSPVVNPSFKRNSLKLGFWRVNKQAHWSLSYHKYSTLNWNSIMFVLFEIFRRTNWQNTFIHQAIKRVGLNMHLSTTTRCLGQTTANLHFIHSWFAAFLCLAVVILLLFTLFIYNYIYSAILHSCSIFALFYFRNYLL